MAKPTNPPAAIALHNIVAVSSVAGWPSVRGGHRNHLISSTETRTLNDGYRIRKLFGTFDQDAASAAEKH